MNNPHTTAAAQIIADALAQIEAITANAQGISDRAYDADDMTDVDTIREARKGLRFIEASGAVEALQAVRDNLGIVAG